MRNIKCQPANPNHPPTEKLFTNLAGTGEFWPGEVKRLADEEEKEGQRLVDNGDFVWTDIDDQPNGLSIEAAFASARRAQDFQLEVTERRVKEGAL